MLPLRDGLHSATGERCRSFPPLPLERRERRELPCLGVSTTMTSNAPDPDAPRHGSSPFPPFVGEGEVGTPDPEEARERRPSRSGSERHDMGIADDLPPTSTAPARGVAFDPAQQA